VADHYGRILDFLSESSLNADVLFELLVNPEIGAIYSCEVSVDFNGLDGAIPEKITPITML
jgi:hypothetical protein